MSCLFLIFYFIVSGGGILWGEMRKMRRRRLRVGGGVLAAALLLLGTVALASSTGAAEPRQLQDGGGLRPGALLPGAGRGHLAAPFHWTDLPALAIQNSVGMCRCGRQGLATADLDFDGGVDYIVSGVLAQCGDACHPSVIVLRDNGLRSRTVVQIEIDFGALQPYSVVLTLRGDADAVPDLLVHGGELASVYSLRDWDSKPLARLWAGQMRGYLGWIRAADYDSDGFDDIFGCGQMSATELLVNPPCSLYRNVNGSFVEVTSAAILGGPGPVQEATVWTSHVVADLTRDGYLDWFVPASLWYPNGVYRNNRNGTLSPVPMSSDGIDRAPF